MVYVSFAVKWVLNLIIFLAGLIVLLGGTVGTVFFFAGAVIFLFFTKTMSVGVSGLLKFLEKTSSKLLNDEPTK